MLSAAACMSRCSGSLCRDSCAFLSHCQPLMALKMGHLPADPSGLERVALQAPRTHGCRAVLVGDPQQLPATVLSKGAQLLERSMFERWSARAAALWCT